MVAETIDFSGTYEDNMGVVVLYTSPEICFCHGLLLLVSLAAHDYEYFIALKDVVSTESHELTSSNGRHLPVCG